MNLRLRSFIAILAALSTLQACVVSTPRPVKPMQDFASVSIQKAPELDGLLEGDSVVFHEGILSSYGQVVIGREYTAASGRLCKRILSVSGNELVTVACRARKEHWYVRTLLIVGDDDGFTSVGTRGNLDDSSLLLPQR